jgi:hypothetical protein
MTGQEEADRRTSRRKIFGYEALSLIKMLMMENGVPDTD